MNRNLSVLLLLLSVPVVSLALVDKDSIYLWDNDRGESNQLYPAVAARDWGAYIAWQDGRWCDFDIYRGARRWSGSVYTSDMMVSNDPYSQYEQTYVDAEGNPTTYSLYAWEDSSYRPAKPTQIWARRHYNAPFCVYAGDRSQKRPGISCRDNGDFVVSFTSYDPGYPRIWVFSYDAGCNFLFRDVVRGEDSLRARVPVSRIAYCDSGFVVVYEDSSADGTQRSIYLQYRKRDGSIVKDRIKVSYSGLPDTYNESYPDVAVNKTGYVVVVWQDFQYGTTDPDVRGQTYQMLPGSDRLETRLAVWIASTTVPQRYPKVTVFPDSNYAVVWDEYTGSSAYGYNVMARVSLDGLLKDIFIVNFEDTLNQGYPDVACRNTDTAYVAWNSEQNSTFDDIFCRSFYLLRDSQYGIVWKTTGDISLISDIAGGRKTWYFDDENYDNPATPTWNEDPIDEPDSIYVDLDFAMVDQIEELNTNGQYVLFNQDTIPQRQKDRALANYDAVFLDLGYRTRSATAGAINSTDRATVVDYINVQGRPSIVEGNDFGYMYDTTALFSCYHAVYRGDGAVYTSGNIDTLYGVSTMIAKGETLKYDYKDLVDNYVDSIAPLDGKLILQSSGAPGRWIAGRSCGWGNYWKDRIPGSTIYNSFITSGIKSTTHPHTYAEYYRRCLGFLGLNCQPEPITTLTAETGSWEGYVIITHLVASDDTIGESAEGPYKLKFARQKITSETAFNDSFETYYQTWNTKDSIVGHLVTRNLYGLPPMDTLIFALKVSDEDTLWCTLGDEPKAVVAGDSVTPHYIEIASNYVKDFSNAFEYLNRRPLGGSGSNYDSLFVTWYYNSSFYVGFARCNFITEGDLFIYVDTKTGGADSTYGYNGASGKSGFTAGFRPDYCFVLEDNTTRYWMRWSNTKAIGWQDSTSLFTGSYSEDGLVNNYLYTEVRIPFTNMAYDSLLPFRLVVLVDTEATNGIANAFPIFNPLGQSKYITQYYQWVNGLRSNLVPNKSGIVIGIEEEQENQKPKTEISRLEIYPNPFSKSTVISYSSLVINDQLLLRPRGSQDRGAITNDLQCPALRIYDVTGRLVKQFNHLSASLTGSGRTGGIEPFNQITWDGTDDNGNTLPQGIYFCEFKTPEKGEVVKIIYIK